MTYQIGFAPEIVPNKSIKDALIGIKMNVDGGNHSKERVSFFCHGFSYHAEGVTKVINAKATVPSDGGVGAREMSGA